MLFIYINTAVKIVKESQNISNILENCSLFRYSLMRDSFAVENIIITQDSRRIYTVKSRCFF
jgi:hypothetical protein